MTSYALPVKFAGEHRLEVDCFIVLTDSETWAGGGAWTRGANASGHVHEQLGLYRQQVNPRAKVVIIGMVSNDMSCANPDDAGQLDMTGFDASVPNLVSDFARSEAGP